MFVAFYQQAVVCDGAQDIGGVTAFDHKRGAPVEVIIASFKIVLFHPPAGVGGQGLKQEDAAEGAATRVLYKLKIRSSHGGVSPPGDAVRLSSKKNFRGRDNCLY